ncbi:MAG: transposase [Faecalibacterium prausnitzii]|jgi:REP element-mobilizing transposase RayT|nr:MAG: transposase [Faecalibacterium prausnitzii]
MKDNKDVDSLSHTTWRCQYHVVFAPKYRRMVIYGQIKKDIGQILRQEYIKNQLQQDQIADQLSLKEFVDP